MSCKANSCPLRAEFVTDYNDDGTPKWGVCRYHQMADYADWKMITARIHEYAPMLKLFSDVHELHDPIVRPLPGEDVPTWVARVRENLRRVITGDYHSQTDGEANFAQLYSALGMEEYPDAKK